MSRKHSVLHSTERHNNRNYKRRIRNLFFEITFIVIFTYVAIKFVNRDGQQPKVSGLSIEEQQQIIDNEMQQKPKIKDENKEIKVPKENESGLQIIKATLKYSQINNQTIINLDVKNYGEALEESKLLLALMDSEGKTMVKTYAKVQYLDKNQQTRVNIVLEGDFSTAESIETREEN